jgi:hypothetical protein
LILAVQDCGLRDALQHNAVVLNRPRRRPRPRNRKTKISEAIRYGAEDKDDLNITE